MTERVNLIKKGEKTTKQIQDELAFKSDRLRKKYDLRNKDPKEINNIWLRSHVKQLKEKSEPKSNA